MNFNDLTVKLTSNANYQSLQPNKQEQIKALINGYESYAQNITQSFYDNIAKMQKEEQDKIKNEQMWGTILNFATLGSYSVVKGVVNNLTDFFTGVINTGTQLINNIGQVFVQDGRFGGGIGGFFKELGSDLLYTVADPILSVAESLAKGGASVANIFGLDDKEFNRFLDSTTMAGVDMRDWILTFGEKEKDSFDFSSGFEFLNNTPDKDKVSRIEEHTFDWARDFSTSVAQGGTWFKDNVAPVISKIITPVGIAIDNLGQNSAGEFFSGIMESIGRMIPSIVATSFGLPAVVPQIYFFSSSFGNGFSEAIARGATLEEAYTYGYGTAAVETLTEQIGGVKIGKLLPGSGNIVMRVIKTGIDEGMEEVMSEAMSAGLESIISDDPVSNSDFMSRAMSAFLGGAISGGIFAGAGYYAHQKSTVGKVNSLNNEIKRIYEGQNQDYGKAQQAFNRKVDSLLNSYNKDSVLDNNLIQEGKRTPESRLQAKKDLLENSGFASLLIEHNEKNQNFQLTKKGIEMTTNLEGYMGDSNKNAYSSTLYGLEDTFATKATNQELTSEQQDVMNLSKKLGSDVVYYTDSDTSINGFLKDGIVYLNTESKKSPLTNFIHELTHSLEGTEQYDTLKNFIMEISETNETLKAKMEELGITKESIIKDYWNQISKLNNIESRAYLMASEYVAFAMSEVVLKDKASIESLTKNKTIGRKILNWIKEKIADVKTPKTDIEKAFLKDLNQAKDLYEEALGLGYRKGLKISEVDKRFSITKDNLGNELSKQQQEFFKDSKVVDENGNLLVVYHGTPNDFNVFDLNRSGQTGTEYGEGIYLTSSKDIANQYTKDKNGKIMEMYANIVKPLNNENVTIDKKSLKKFLKELVKIEEYALSNYGEISIDDVIEQIYDNADNDLDIIGDISAVGHGIDNNLFYETLIKNTKYDGIFATLKNGDNIYIAFNSNQLKNINNLNPTSSEDIRFSRDLTNGVNTETEIPFMEKNINESYNNFNKKQFFIDNNLRTKDFNNVFSKKEDISKRKNGKKIVAILDKLEKDYGYIIRKQDRRGELYNYLFNNVLEQIVVELDSNFSENGFNNKEQIINNIERVISNTMVYLDNTFNNNELNISTNNPQGFQYTRGFNWAMREFNVENKDMELIKKGVGNIVNLIDAVINLDLTDNKSIDMFMAGIGSFRNATHVEQRNSLALETSGNRVHTLPNVLRQNSVHIDALTKINGNYTKGFDGKNVYNKGLLGYDFMKGLNNPLLDMYAFGNIFGMGMEKSLGNVITKQLENATIKQLTVTNRFNEFFEKDGFIKKNTDNFNRIESEVIEVSNLIDKNGEKVFIPKSQVMTLRNIMLREIVRNRLIESGIRGGELSNKFNKDMIVYFNGNSDNNLKNKKHRRSFKIKNTFDLFNELDNIVNNDSFMSKYNKKLLSFFETMYEYENNANKDLRGRELTNDKVFIENLSEQERNALKQGLNDNVDISLIYVPMTSLNESGQSGSGAFDINRVIDLGIDDGMVMGIQENENPSLIDSVNTVVSKYAKSVSNFYGLYRITEDLNLLFNKEIYVSPTQKITLKAKVDNLNPNIIKFYETLLRNMSGYQIEKDSLYSKVNKILGVVKRNFYKATLGGNFKVISTQFASLFTTGTMYGDFKGTKKSLTLGMWKNVFAKGSKTKAKYLIENSEIYKDRARNSINEVYEAQSSKFNRSRFNRFTEFTMKGINLTDSMINRALFITLVEHGYSEQQALKMTEQAILRYQSSGLAIGKNSLLRTEHEVVKLFTKFLSEPMKVVSNVIESVNKLKVIKNLESNKTNIVSHFENELSNLIKENDKLKNDLSKLDEKVDKELIKELKEEIKFNDDKILDLERYNKTIENQINNVIESKDETKKVFAKRLTGAMLSLLWQTSLGVIFSQMRFGNDDKDEDEETWVYLSKKFGWQLASEFVGYIPIGRDIYGMLMDDFDINVIDEFSAYNDLFSNISSLYKDVANGNDFDWGKHLRKSIITIGQLTGIPTKNIERVFTTPTKWFSKSLNYSYRDITGQYIGSNELNNAIKNGDEKLIETIINRKMNEKNISLTNATTREINRLAKNGVVVSPSGIPNSFSIDGVEYKNDKDKFAKTYNNASFVVEKVISQSGYKRLDDEYKAKLIKAIFTYYHSLAKQNVSGVQIFTKERTYNLNQAYRYFRDRIPYYMNKQQKEKKKKRA